MEGERSHSLLDIHFARFLAARSGFSGDEKKWFSELVARLSGAMSVGHICLPLPQEERRLLLTTHLVSESGQTPLIIHNSNLYLNKYFQYESRLARQLRARADVSYDKEKDTSRLLDHYFGRDTSEIDWQKRGAAVALEKGLTIISGGPGTGKTSTVSKIIAILLQASGNTLRIGLAAPTGKAAMRLQLSIGGSLETLACPEEIRASIPREAKTLHRLLGVRRNSPQFRHDGDNPMSWDVVIVDEASMIDLALMSKLVDALKPGSRLILLGDKDQLASVESGAVLADCIRSLPDNTVELRKTYRFDAGIKGLAESINGGCLSKVWAILQDKDITNVSLMDSDIYTYIGRCYVKYMEEILQIKNGNMKPIFVAFAKFQVLCSVHYGERGVAGINRKVEFYLAGRGFECKPDSWYAGRPVLISRNDYNLGLYNGDIGICIPDSTDNKLKVWFEQKDGGFKSYLPYRLPKCETAFAMTIHKSQGSEFEEVLVVLPGEDNRVLCRELLYTAVTRARERVRIDAEEKVLELGLSRQIQRYSGLAEQLQSGN
jgi:exodeoxyribonuclease V alpha subunit